MEMPNLTIGHHISQLPIIQGGMGVGISLSGLASAVANQGGIGVIATAMIGMNELGGHKDGSQAHMDALRREIRKARALTDGIIGVNIMGVLTNFGDMVRTAIEEGIDIIFTGAGLPLDLPGYLDGNRHTKLVPIVSSGRAAMLICKKWLARYGYLPDGFVVEGPMAGGHLGFKAEQLDSPDFKLENLVVDVVEAVKAFEDSGKKSIPVIAAGGIYDGVDIRRFLELGAAGAQMGTRFVATHECDADEAFKQAYIDSRKEDLVVIKSPVGLPGRVIRNRFIDSVNAGEKKPLKCSFHCVRSCNPDKSPYCIAMALECARKGKLKNGFAFAGSNAYRVNEIVSVKELIDSLRMEYSWSFETARANVA